MANPFGAPEVSVQEVAQKVENGDKFVWIDVREPRELELSHYNVDGILNVPLSEVGRQQLAALPEAVTVDKNAEIVVSCHHGGRSAQMVMFLRSQGWTNAVNLDGGIHAWAIEIDPSVGTYHN